MGSKRIYILGAGSSIGHSKGLFPSITGFFSSAKKLGLSFQSQFNLISNYAEKVIGQNILSGKDRTDIEALFTHIEIEIERKPSSDLLAIRQQLLKLIQEVLIGLEEKLNNQKGEYHEFISMIGPKDTIITFNWDLLLDNLLNRKKILADRLMQLKDNDANSGQYWKFIIKLSAFGEQTIDGIAFEKPYRDWNPATGYYLKAHGSVDWFYCSNESCRASRKTFPLLEPALTHYCSECHEPLESLLIPPALNKEYRHYPLIRRIWNLAAKELNSAEELIIWGYSLPPTDFYCHWLLRQARESPLRSLVIINPSVFHRYRGKKKQHTVFIRRFYDIFKDKISNNSLYLYESFADYFKNYHPQPNLFS
jgi:hypothetical protein